MTTGPDEIFPVVIDPLSRKTNAWLAEVLARAASQSSVPHIEFLPQILVRQEVEIMASGAAGPSRRTRKLAFHENVYWQVLRR
jgi:hypothetical protein